MNLSVYLLIILTKSIIYSTVCAKNLDIYERIVGGHEAKPNSHPYIVSLQTRFLWIRAHVCGGSVLSERWILSAAHCVLESWLSRLLPMDAIAGAHDVDDFGPKAQVITIGERIPHPLYEGGIGPYDIALFKTISPFTFTNEVKPISLPFNSNIESNRLALAGWGLLRTTAFIPDIPSKLQEVEVTFIPFDECYKAINELLEDDETNPLDREANICSGPVSGGVGACQGDSGGPLVYYKQTVIDEPYDSVEDNTELYNKDNYNCTNRLIEENEQNNDVSERKYADEIDPVVVGIVSWGVSPCGKKGAPTVYTNVNSYIDFINYFMNEQNYI